MKMLISPGPTMTMTVWCPLGVVRNLPNALMHVTLDAR